MKDTEVIKIIRELFTIYKRDRDTFSEVSSIFMLLSEGVTNKRLRSFCIDASVVIGETLYDKPTGMSFEELEAEYKLLQK